MKKTNTKKIVLIIVAIIVSLFLFFWNNGRNSRLRVTAFCKGKIVQEIEDVKKYKQPLPQLDYFKDSFRKCLKDAGFDDFVIEATVDKEIDGINLIPGV